MPEVLVAHPGTSADVRLQLNHSISSYDAANNRSYWSVSLVLYVAAYNGAGGPVDNNNWSTGSVNSSIGLMINWQGHYDLRSSVASSVVLGTWAGWVNHDSAGNLAISFTYAFSGQGGTPLGVGSGSSSLTATRIPKRPSVPGIPVFTEIMPQSVRGTTTASTDNGGSAITGYVFRRYETVDGTGSYTDSLANNLTRILSGLTPGKTYSYRTLAKNSSVDNGGYSNPSALVVVTTLAPARVKVAGVWKYGIPYVKVAGVWKMALPFVKVAGVWKKTG